MLLPRVLEPEVMDTADEAIDYDSMDHSAVNQRFIDDLLQFLKTSVAELQTRSPCVLDLGTGTAQVPVQLCRDWPACGPVIACDLSVEMLKLACGNLRAAECSHKVLAVLSDAKRLPVRDESCDVVMSNSIMHHIPRPLDVFREITRVMKAGGGLFVRDLMRPPDGETVAQFVELYAGSDSAHQQQLFRQSLHAALTIDEVRTLLTDSGLPSSWVQATSDRHWTVAGVINARRD